MGVFDLMEQYDYGEVHLRRDAATGLKAIIAIHDTRLGPSLGGCRFIHYDTHEAAITDAVRLARGMTYKAAISGIALGGGKSVIIKPKGDFDREALFAAFGQFIDDLGGRYITAEDSGTGLKDMDSIRTKTKHVTGIDPKHGGSGDPSPYTALGVLRGLQALVKFKLGRSDLQGLKVAVQGVGNVGYSLAKQLRELGAELTVTDINEKAVKMAQDELGAKAVGLDEIFGVECDVFAPCALGAGINDKTIPQLKCQVVAGAANNVLAEPRHGDELHKRGILYGPDYAINAGGLMNVALEVKGYDEVKARKQVEGIYDIIWEIAERGKKNDRPTYKVADELAEEKLQQAK